MKQMQKKNLYGYSIAHTYTNNDCMLHRNDYRDIRTISASNGTYCNAFSKKSRRCRRCRAESQSTHLRILRATM